MSQWLYLLLKVRVTCAEGIDSNIPCPRAFSLLRLRFFETSDLVFSSGSILPQCLSSPTGQLWRRRIGRRYHGPNRH